MMLRGASVERFRTLDVIRGCAAAMVAVFHVGNGVPIIRDHLGGFGVFLFFPVSGYCLYGAIQHSRRPPVAFLARRFRRLYAPYWASVALATAIAIAGMPFSRGSAADIFVSPAAWLSVVTLTQTMTGFRGAVNPVYWSLCYEVQFCLLMAAMLLVPRQRRAPLAGWMTVIAAAYVLLGAGRFVIGLFLDYWANFALGIAAYLWLHERHHRHWAVLTFGSAAFIAGSGVATMAGVTSLTATMAMVALYSMDGRVANAAVLRPLLFIGTISYSLYLLHVPVGGRVVHLLTRFDVPSWVAVPAALAVSVLAATVFFALVERPSRPRSRVPQPTLQEPAAPAAVAA